MTLPTHLYDRIIGRLLSKEITKSVSDSPDNSGLILIEGFENHLDSSFDTGTKTAGPAEDDFHDPESVVAMPFPLKWALLSIATSLLISANHSWDRLLNAAGNGPYPTEPKT